MKRCLLVIDYQNDFVTGPLGTPEAAEMEARIAKKILLYRDRRDKVLYTLDRHRGNYLRGLEGKAYPLPHCLRRTEGERPAGMVGSLLRRYGKRFRKETFGSDRLYAYLFSHRFLSIEVVGVVSHVCVLANIVLARTAQPETPIRVQTDCIAGTDPALHAAVLSLLPGLLVTLLPPEKPIKMQVTPLPRTQAETPAGKTPGDTKAEEAMPPTPPTDLPLPGEAPPKADVESGDA